MNFWPDSIFGWIMIGACVVLTLLPPKWDPAIRLKERLSGRNDGTRNDSARRANADFSGIRKEGE